MTVRAGSILIRSLPLWFALFLVAGCGEDDGCKPNPEEPAGYPAATTIPQLLANLERAYDERDYDEYSKLLDEGFEFVFDPRDVGECPITGDRWPVRDEQISAWNMFGGIPDLRNRIAQGIGLALHANDSEVSPEDPEWKRVILTGVDLEVHALDRSTGEYWILQTPPGYETYLHLVQTDAGDGSQVWKIVLWEDRPPLGASLRSGSTEMTSWGMIKAYFR